MTQSTEVTKHKAVRSGAKRLLVLYSPAAKAIIDNCDPTGMTGSNGQSLAMYHAHDPGVVVLDMEVAMERTESAAMRPIVEIAQEEFESTFNNDLALKRYCDFTVTRDAETLKSLDFVRGTVTWHYIRVGFELPRYFKLCDKLSTGHEELVARAIDYTAQLRDPAAHPKGVSLACLDFNHLPKVLPGERRKILQRAKAESDFSSEREPSQFVLKSEPAVIHALGLPAGVAQALLDQNAGYVLVNDSRTWVPGWSWCGVAEFDLGGARKAVDTNWQWLIREALYVRKNPLGVTMALAINVTESLRKQDLPSGIRKLVKAAQNAGEQFLFFGDAS